MLGKHLLLPGVDKMITHISVEATFKDGTKTITINDPIATDYGDLELAFYGSCMSLPSYDSILNKVNNLI